MVVGWKRRVDWARRWEKRGKTTGKEQMSTRNGDDSTNKNMGGDKTKHNMTTQWTRIWLQNEEEVSREMKC
jgi:hypothetical protein